MDNAGFEEDIPMIHQDKEDNDYDNYNTPNASKIDETSFIEHDATEPTSTLRLRQKVKRDKINAFYRHLNVMGNSDLIDLDRFRLTTDPKKGTAIFEFYNGNDRWVPLTKQTSEFFTPLKDRFGGVNAMKNFLGIDETPPALERSVKAASNRKSELPTDLEMDSILLKDLSSLVENIHIKTREASQQTNNLDMREFLGIDRALQSIQDELLNNTSKLKGIDERIERDTKKLKEVEDDPTYSHEQRQL